jgi:hypothetical protein
MSSAAPATDRLANAASQLGAQFAQYTMGVRNIEDLRSAVCAYTEAARESGLFAERVIVNLKTMASQAGFGPLRDRSPTHEPIKADDDIVKQSVVWCIHHYYDKETPAGK